MQHDVKTCKNSDTVAMAGQVLGRIGAGILPVLDEEGRVVGIVTDRDLILSLVTRDARPSDLAVGDIMRQPVHSCAASDEIINALEQMHRHGVRRLPVVGHDGRIEGILSLDDVVATSRANFDEAVAKSLDSAIVRILEAGIEHRSSPVAALRALE